MCVLTPRDRSRRPDSASRRVLARCRYIVYSHISTQPRGGSSLLARKSGGEKGEEGGPEGGTKPCGRRRIWMSHGAEAAEQWL